jgi:hypothetical protein
MSETHSIDSSLLQALQDFVGDPDLEALEKLAKRFNIFEVLGVVRAERIHSNFLGFLLNPKESHGLGDRFLKRFLKTALDNETSVAPLTPAGIDLFDLSQAEVHIEHDRFDVLIRDAQNHISVIVEIKIDSTQHSNQLERYYQRECLRYPESNVFGVYLTIDGDDPRHKHYAPLSHSDIRT